MAAPSRAEIEAMIRNAIDCLEEAREHYDTVHAVATTGTIDVLEQSLEGDFAPSGYQGFSAAFRSALSSSISVELARAAWSPGLYEYAKFIGAPESSDIHDIIDRVFQYMIDNSLALPTRAITHNSPVAGGGNVGNGTINRLYVDENNLELEAMHVELKTAKCVIDQNTTGGQRHAEVFEGYGEESSKDSLLVAGSGERFKVLMYARHCGSGPGGSLLQNPSFSTYSSSGTTTTKFPSWVIAGAAANVQQDTTNFYRSHPGAAVDGSIQFNANERIYQRFADIGLKIKPRTPYYLQLVFNRQVGACDGTLTLRLGAVSAAVVLAAQTGWNILRIAIGQNNWYRTFSEDNADIEIEWSGRTAGTLLVDDVIFSEYDFFDGTWYCPVGGTTPWMLDDVFTWTDTGGAAGTGIMQYWLWRAYGRYLPQASGGGITWADPT